MENFLGHKKGWGPPATLLTQPPYGEPFRQLHSGKKTSKIVLLKRSPEDQRPIHCKTANSRDQKSLFGREKPGSQKGQHFRQGAEVEFNLEESKTPIGERPNGLLQFQWCAS